MDSVLRGIQRVCSAGLDSVSLRVELMRRLQPAVAFDAFAFSTVDPDTGIMSHTVRSGIPMSLGRMYVERLYSAVGSSLADEASRHASPVVSMRDMGPETQDAFRTAGVDLHIHVTHAAEGRLWGTCCLVRSAGSAPLTSRTREIVRRTTPWITRALRSAAAVDEACATSGDDVDTVAPGVLVLDTRHRPVMRTPLATRWLVDIADVRERATADGEELPFSVLGLAAYLRRSRTDAQPEAVLRVRGASGVWYVLRASLTEPDAGGASSVVVVIRPALRREVAPVLSRLYGLSGRERDVVAAVSRGESTKHVAAALRVSPHTVEEHLERACRKIGVRGRKALVAKLFVDGYAPGLGAERPRLT